MTFVWRPRDVLRELGELLDRVPYAAVLAVPFAWAAWAMGLGGNATPNEIETSWWFKGYLTMIAFVPSMGVCAIIEWQAGRRGWRRTRVAVQVFRWAHFLVAFAPILAFAVLLTLPSSWQPF